MLKNFLILTFRNMLRQPFSSFINLTGLALGFASFIIIGLYVYDEQQYDKFHEKGERIFRIYSNTFNKERVMANLPALLYEPLKENLPEIESISRINNTYRAMPVSYGDKTFMEDGIIFTDTTFFNIFSFSLQRGNLADFNNKPNGVLITSAIAEKYFEDEDPIGNLLDYNGQVQMEVVGILDDIPQQSHLQFTILANYDLLKIINPFTFQAWGNYSANYYVLLKEGVQPDSLQGKMLKIFAMHYKESLDSDEYYMKLQNLRDVYLNSARIDTNLRGEAGSRPAVMIFSVSAILLLLMACFNYVNLTSAKSISRAKEVGVRKVIGAGRVQLIGLFLAESFVVSLIAVVIAVGLVELSIPYFSQLSGKEIGFSLLPAYMRLLLPLALALVVALAAGIYPALVMSGFKPALALKGSAMMIGWQLKRGFSPELRLRQLLIVLQFAMSIGLVAGSIILYQQTGYAISNSGFEKESLIVVRNSESPPRNAYLAFKNRLIQYPFITHVSAAEHMPTNAIGNQGALRYPHQNDSERVQIYFAAVDFDYFETLRAKLAWGRTFDATLATDTVESVVLNQSAADALGISEGEFPVLNGFWDGNNKRVAGVVENILFESAHRQVKPTAFVMSYGGRFGEAAYSQMVVRFKAESLSEVVDAIEHTWSATAQSGIPIEYYFMDSNYQALYKKELQISGVANVFTILAVFIALLGLLGTTVYVMESRRKELGVRKVLGATTLQLAVMISREFLLLVVLALLVAWPMCWHVMSGWLDGFAYRIQLSPYIFVLSGAIGLLLALITVNALAWRFTTRNPVEALKYE